MPTDTMLEERQTDSYQQTALSIFNETYNIFYSQTLTTEETIALARLITSMYMISYLNGGFIYTSSEFETLLRDVADALGKAEQTAQVRNALADMARTGLFDIPAAAPVADGPTPADLSDCHTADQLLSYYLNGVLASYTLPTKQLTDSILSQAASIPTPTLSDRLTLHYVTYTAIDEYEGIDA